MESVFISSVQTGLEEVRDVVAQTVEALDLRVLMAERAAASPEAPKPAMLGLVHQADVVVLILGARYGTRGESGFSPTEDEFNEASALGRPVLILIEDVEREAAQNAFIARARGTSWEQGRFSASFQTTQEAAIQTIKALRALERKEVVLAREASRGASPSLAAATAPFWNANPRYAMPLIDTMIEALRLRAAGGLANEHWLVPGGHLDRTVRRQIIGRLADSPLAAWLAREWAQPPIWEAGAYSSSGLVALQTGPNPALSGRPLCSIAGCWLQLGGSTLGPSFASLHLELTLLRGEEPLARISLTELVAITKALLRTYGHLTTDPETGASSPPTAFTFFLETGSDSLGAWVELPELARAAQAHDPPGSGFDLGAASELERPADMDARISDWVLRLLLDRGFDISTEDVEALITSG